MGIGVKLVFDMLAFTSVMVLIVLGLGRHRQHDGHLQFRPRRVRAARRLHALPVPGQRAAVLDGDPGRADRASRCVGLVLERLVIRRFYAAPIIAMLGTYAHRAGDPRDRARPAGRPLQVDLRAAAPARSASAAWTSRSGARSSSSPRWSSSSRAGCSCPAPRSACRSAARWRIRRLRAPAASRPQRLYALTFAFGVGARRPGRRADRAALPAVGRHRHPLPGAGVPVGHARRRRDVRRTGARRRRGGRHGGGLAVDRPARCSPIRSFS